MLFLSLFVGSCFYLFFHLVFSFFLYGYSLKPFQFVLVNNVVSEYPVLLTSQYVDKDFGARVLKISPGHDRNDNLVARKLGLPILNVIRLMRSQDCTGNVFC